MTIPLSDMQKSLLSGCLAWFAVCQTRGHTYCSTFGSTLISTVVSHLFLHFVFSISREQLKALEMMPLEFFLSVSELACVQFIHPFYFLFLP